MKENVIISSSEYIDRNGKTYYLYTAVSAMSKEPAGSIKLKQKKLGWTLNSLYVSPGQRRKGIARKLIETVLQQHNDEYLFIRPRPFKDAPMETKDLRIFYSSCGFIDFGEKGHMKYMPNTLNKNLF